MLTVGAGSSCDVCLEPFGADEKCPCSIVCGHVFCAECLHNLTRPACPLCRHGFNPNLTVKLHIELDTTRPSPTPTFLSTTSVSAEQEARRLHEAIAGIAETGSTESNLRQLIEDGRSFLRQQPRSLYRDLRTAHQMITYLCEVKSTLRSQNGVVETLTKQVAELAEEKADLAKQVEDLTILRQVDSETAIAVEVSLREHCTKAHAAYEAMVGQYNVVAQEYASLDAEVRRLRGEADSKPAHKKSLPGLKGAAVQNPNSYTVSPLPQFTGALNTGMSLFMPLPELEEDDGEDGDDDDDDDEVEENADPSEHLKYGLANKTHPGRSDSPSPEFDYGYRRFFPSSTGSPSSPIPPPGEDHFTNSPNSDLLRTAPAKERRRSRPSSSSSRPSSTATSSSGDVPRALSSPKPQSPYPGSAHDGESSRGHVSMPSGDNDQLRTRLHDLLHDPSLSSSLPNMTPNHFPASLTHRDSHHDEGYAPRRTLSEKRITQAGPSAGPSFVDHSSHPPMSHVAVPHPRPLTSNGSSSASAAAKALEKAKKEQERERRRAEKERSKVDRDSDRSRTNATPETSHPRARERASSSANAPWSSTSSFSSGNSRASSNSENSRGSSSSGASLPPLPRSSSSNGPASWGSSQSYTSAASHQPRYPSAGLSKGLSSGSTAFSIPSIYS